MTNEEFMAITGATPREWLRMYRGGQAKEAAESDCLYCSAMSLLPPIKVFLDDNRNPSQIYAEAGSEWITVKTVPEAIMLLIEDNVSHLSLDNDLGEGQQEGYTLVNWMIRTDIWPTTAVYVHSHNIVRAKQMSEDITRHFRPEK